MYRLFFERIEVNCSIGLHDFERRAKQRLFINVELFLTRTDRTDAASTVPDYDDVRDIVIRIAGSRHFELQESICETICETVFASGRYDAVLVTSRKPDVYPNVDAVGCTVAMQIDGFNQALAQFLRGR
jgi:dihydroneopterin aldolase